MTSHFSEPSTGAIALSAKAKALTRFLLDGTALPDFLSQHGNVLLAFLGGTAATSLLYNYFHQHRADRARIKLAVFHITRIIENTPEYHSRLDHPHELVQVMQEEINHMMNVHLNGHEAASTMSELKRKLWTEVDDERAVIKRRKSNDMALKDSCVDGDLEIQGAETASASLTPKLDSGYTAASSTLLQEDGKLRLSEEKQEQQEIAMVDIEEPSTVRSASSLDRTTYNYKTSSPHQPSSSQQVLRPLKTPSPHFSQISSAEVRTPPSENVLAQLTLLNQTPSSCPSLPARPPTRRARYDSSPPSTSKLPPSSIGRSTYRYPSYSESETEVALPNTNPRSTVHSSPGYGLDYDDCSSPSPVASTKASPKRGLKSEKPPNMLQLALKRAGLGSNGAHHVPVKSRVKGKPKATKSPSTVKIQEPPNSMAVRTGNEDKGTWLHPIQEGASPHHSPAPSVTQMRVAESRPFYRQIEADRKERRSIRHFFKQGAEIERARREKEEAAPEKKGVAWPDPTFTYSSSEDNNSVHVNVALSPTRAIESPPSVPEISPPLPSPPREPRTPKMSSPLSSPISDLPQSDINFSSPTMPDVIRVAAPPNRQESSQTPITSSTPTKKRGRGRPRKEQKPDTPLPAKRLGRPKNGMQLPATPVPSHRSLQVTAEPQTPVQAEIPSGRSARKSVFKGSYKY